MSTFNTEKGADPTKEETKEVNTVIPINDELKEKVVIHKEGQQEVNTDKLEDARTTKVLEEKGVKGNINGVLDPGGGTKAKERTNCKYPDGKEKQPGAENDDPGDYLEMRKKIGIYQGSTLRQCT